MGSSGKSMLGDFIVIARRSGATSYFGITSVAWSVFPLIWGSEIRVPAEKWEHANITMHVCPQYYQLYLSAKPL